MLLVTLLLRLQRARGPLGAVSCADCSVSLPLFPKVMVEDGIGNRFWFSGSFLDKKRTHPWPLASTHKTGGAPDSFHLWRWTCFQTQLVSCSRCSCRLNSTSGSQECKSPEKKRASYCSSLLIFYPSQCLEQRKVRRRALPPSWREVVVISPCLFHFSLLQCREDASCSAYFRSLSKESRGMRYLKCFESSNL